ncbi:MAG: ketopantoate reductase family protein [Paludibacteraceae bacterium]
MKQTKILFLGLGGVGGYYGGKMAKRYVRSDDVKIYFIARGEHLKAICEKGLRVITDEDEFIAKPIIATDNPTEIGIVDYVILSTKSYDLGSSIESVLSCIDKNTVILPLLNGGDITERIREILPENTVWSGCSYIVSRRVEPGVIHKMGTPEKLVFGYNKGVSEQRHTFEKLLKDAEIDVVCPENIRDSIWKKFYFISVSASLTSYLNVSFNELVDTDERREMASEMAEEFLNVAKAEGINMGKNSRDDVLSRSEALPKDTTTSMHSDFKAGNRTEVETLTGVVVRLALKHGISVPLYEKVYEKLKKRSK